MRRCEKKLLVLSGDKIRRNVLSLGLLEKNERDTSLHVSLVTDSYGIYFVGRDYC
mgnify:CR=1 FL=1